MKKTLTVLFCLLALFIATQALADVPVDEAHFPDTNFRNHILNKYDENGNGILSDAEIAEVTNMYVSDKKISSLKGLEYFTSLTLLYCDNNYLSSLDISHNTNLGALSCVRNSIYELDVSKCPRLVNLVKNYERESVSTQSQGTYSQWNANAYGSLILNTPLTTTVIAGDFISRPEIDLDSSFFPDSDFRRIAATFDLNGDGELSEDEISKVKEIDCSGQDIYNLTGIEWFTSLEVLHCENNGLTFLDVRRNTALTFLYCQNNDFRLLDVSMCPKLCAYMNEYPRLRNSGYDDFGDRFRFDSNVKVTGDYVSETAYTPSVGDTFNSNGLKYKITAEKTVSCIGAANAKSLSSVNIPAEITYARTDFTVTEITDKAFYKDTGIKTLTVGKNVKTIGKNAFAGCSKMTTVKGGAAVITIKDSAFMSCKALKSFPALNKLQTIGASVFKGCVKLTKFTIGKNVKKIGKNAFNGCKALKTLTINSTKLTAKNVGAGAFKGIHKKATVKVPKNKLNDYQKWLVKKGVPKTATIK